ncbi:PKD domain-containing protein [Cohnella terricola]|uniref:PKD/Chitinase domain-containing protein n=1 Tax=Cohnella terricola TaxID=1289167 RepID=A0A559JFQ0_9BACL|nr:PKD domain-containing protein [Cohnella terricola]TVX98704.1 hypothetical protein FPZ45_15505 [Cohnella terricola]
MKVVRVFVPIVFEIELEGKIEVHHYTTNGQNIDALFPNQSTDLKAGQTYAVTPATNVNYAYVGYKKSTVSPPTGGNIIEAPPERFTYNGSYDTYYLNLYYRQDGGAINVRQMVKTGTTGGYANKGTESIEVKKLPDTQIIQPKTNYGTVVGSSISYEGGYSDVIASGKSQIVNLTETKKTAYVSFFYENSVSGDFDILPSPSIKWRDSFSLKPKNFIIPASCTYLYHEYYFEKDGEYWTSAKVRGETVVSTFSYSGYPSILGVGTNYISIKVTADCANSGWVNQKPLNIESPQNNRPPVFSVGFFKEPNRTGTRPDYEVVINRPVNLRIIYDKNANPPEPYDPDGDSISYTFLFGSSSSSWIRSLPGNYGLWEHDEAYYNLKATELGTHTVTVIARDTFGAESRRTASINVIPENPIPVITGPTKVKENRPLPSPFSGEKSYSPIGRTIKEYIWENKKDVYTTPGTETIRLDVVDSGGLKSLYSASHQLTVIPDEPPIGVLEVPPLGIRPNDFNIFNKSYSPDGDKVVSIQYRYKYDANNDGIFDEPWTTMPGGDLTKIAFRPPKVGKYVFDARVCEDYGKCAWASDTQPESSRMMDAVNLAPSVSFLIEGENEIPKPPTDSSIPASEILKNWSLYEVNTTTPLDNKPYMWSKEGKSLLAGLGKGMEKQYAYPNSYAFQVGQNVAQLAMPPIQDNGFGMNGKTPYKGIVSRDTSKSQPILIPYKNGKVQTAPNSDDYDYLEPTTSSEIAVRSNKTYILFKHEDYIFAYNKNKIPRVYTDTDTIADYSGTYPNIKWYLRYRWADGNPYDYILDLKNTSAPKRIIPYFTYMDRERNSNAVSQAFAGNYSGASGSGPSQDNLIGYEITGSRIYLFYERYTFAYYYKPDGEPSETRYSAATNERFMDIHVFDAYTGQFLGSSYDKGVRIPVMSVYPSSTITKGDNVMIFSDNTYPGSNPTAYEIDRNGKLASQKSIALPTKTEIIARNVRNFFGQIYTENPIAFTCKWTTITTYWKDENSNVYTYGYNVCEAANGAKIDASNADINPGAPAGLHLVKWNSDLSFAGSYRLSGTGTGSYITGMYDPNIEQYPALVINSEANEAITKTASSGGMFSNTFHSNRVNLTTGDVTNWPLTHPKASSDNFNPGFHIKQDGSYGSSWRTHTVANEVQKNNWHADQMMRNYRWSNYYGGGYDNKTQTLRFGEYMGDGIYLSIYDGQQYDFVSGQFSQAWETTQGFMFLDTGTTSATAPYKGFKLGQFVSPEAYEDAEYTFTINMDAPREETSLAGMSFRMTNPKYRYAVETSGTKLFLSKYVNGTRTVLDSIDVPFQAHTDYSFKIVTQRDEIAVFMDGVPYFEVKDTTYQSGKFGPFSDKSYVAFSGIDRKDLSNPDVEWLASYAIWDEGKATASVRYSNMIYADPEDDPAAQNNLWTISHTPKFLNNQGLSALHGQTLTSPALTFDKVGNYRVALKAQDDPHPDYLYPDTTFGDYRKWSNEFWQVITVHRRPVAKFTVSVIPNDHTVVWNDQSYDPDRWLSPSNYSTEATGIDYKNTRGVLEWRYYYITPDGDVVNQKLVTPQMSGKYRVGMQVKDEYSAWSYWAEQTIDITTPVLPDDPPIPGFIVTPSTNYRNEPFTIQSTAWDKEDGPAANLKHVYYVRNVTENGLESPRSTDRGTWSTTFSSLGVIEIRQVVTDSKGQSAQAIRRVAVINRKPIADFDWKPKPVFEGDTVTLANLSSDPDGDPLSYEWTIVAPDGYRFAGATKDMAIPGRLTENNTGSFTVTLRVTDSYGASDSATKQIPVAELTIAGQVAHTSDWDKNRLNWNAKYPAKFRAENVFWAGEAFVLSAETTDTGSSETKAVAVEAAATAELKKTLTAQPPGTISWRGLLREADTNIVFVELPDGMYTFVFTVTYSNGVRKTSSVPIEIRGKVDQYMQVHRIQ